MSDFRGARVGVLEARLEADIATMVRRLGGRVISAPALREVPRAIPDMGKGLIERLASAEDPVLVCLTGSGVRALLAQAAGEGCLSALHDAIARATTVCRGPKPAGVLAAHGLPVTLRAAEPFTNAEVMNVLEPVWMDGRFVVLLHYGEQNIALSSYLRDRGADVYDLLPYEWQLPEETEPVARLADEIIAGRVDAVAFTSQIQVRHLLAIAGADRRTPLVEALNRKTVVGAIGPTCDAALTAAGIRAAVVASPPKLAPLLAALADAVHRGH
jgi:uroporphyrinogen-III synthase